MRSVNATGFSCAISYRNHCRNGTRVRRARGDRAKRCIGNAIHGGAGHGPQGSVSMRRKVLCVSVLLVVAPVVGRAATQSVGAAEPAKGATAAPAHPKRHAVRHGHGYGFLPGYRPPEQIQWEDTVAAWRRGPA